MKIQHHTVHPENEKVLAQQRLRLQRYGMAAATYLVVIVTLFLTDEFGFGHLGQLHWMMILALSLVGNVAFFLLIQSGANLRFSDPSLTWLQIFYAGVVVMVVLSALPEMRPTALMFFIPAFSFGMLRLPRKAYLSLVACVMGFYTVLLTVEYINHRPGLDIRYELFLYILFGIVLTWFAVFGGFISDVRRRLRIQAKTIKKANEEIRLEIEERKKAQIEKDRLIVELQDAISKVKTLSGLIPICATCKKIRDDKGYWNQLELYITTHSDAAFTHGICPDCAKAAMEEVHRKK